MRGAWTTRSSSAQQDDIRAYHIKIPLFPGSKQCSICSREHGIVPSFMPLHKGESYVRLLPPHCPSHAPEETNSLCVLELDTYKQIGLVKKLEKEFCSDFYRNQNHACQKAPCFES